MVCEVCGAPLRQELTENGRLWIHANPPWNCPEAEDEMGLLTIVDYSAQTDCEDEASIRAIRAFLQSEDD